MNISTLRLNETVQSKPLQGRWRKHAAMIFLSVPCFFLALGMIATPSARADETETSDRDEEHLNETSRFEDEDRSDYREFGADVFVAREDDRRGPPHRGPGFRGGSERGRGEAGPRGRDGERGHAKKGDHGGDRHHGSHHAHKGPPNRSKALAKHHKVHGSHARGPHGSFAHRGGKPGSQFAHKGPPRHRRPGFGHGPSRGYGSFARGGHGGFSGHGAFGRGGFGPHSFAHRGGKPGSFARGHAIHGHRGLSQLAHRGSQGSRGRGPHFSGLQSRGHFAARGSLGGFGSHGFGPRGVGAHGSPRGVFGRGEHASSASLARGGSQGNQQLIRLVAQLSKEVKELRAEVKSLKGEHGGRGGDDRKGPPRDKDSKGDHKDGKKDPKQVRGEFRGGDREGHGPRFMHAESGGRGFGGGGFGGGPGFGGTRFGRGFDGQGVGEQGRRPSFRPSQDRDDDGPRGERVFRGGPDRERRDSKSNRGPGDRFEEEGDSDI